MLGAYANGAGSVTVCQTLLQVEAKAPVVDPDECQCCNSLDIATNTI
jgi:hypothetical protein